MKQLAPPTPNISARDRQEVVSGKATLVAALPRVPTARPMKNWSTILYTEPTSMAMMLGTANFIINRGMGA